MIPKNLRTSILSPIASATVRLGQWLSSHSQDEENGIMIVHCMDARLNARHALKPYMVVPNALTPAGAIVTSDDLSVKKRFEVAHKKFAMRDILIMGHQHCSAMGQLTDVLLGKKEDDYYGKFLLSSNEFPKLDLSDYIERGRIVTPQLPDNLALLTALHSARNTLALDVGNQTSVADLIDSGEIRFHIGYTELELALDKKWVERHHLLSPDGTNLVRVENLAKAIIARRDDSSNLPGFKDQLEAAQFSFAARLNSGMAPTDKVRA